jgi:uncharacterized DUF497 family protein
VPRQYQFEWDAAKAAVNLRKHRVAFELASSIFADPTILTVPDLAHSETEERWISIGYASSGILLTVAYTWTEAPSLTKVRLITARKSTKNEISYYQKGA